MNRLGEVSEVIIPFDDPEKQCMVIASNNFIGGLNYDLFKGVSPNKLASTNLSIKRRLQDEVNRGRLYTFSVSQGIYLPVISVGDVDFANKIVNLETRPGVTRQFGFGSICSENEVGKHLLNKSRRDCQNFLAGAGLLTIRNEQLGSIFVKTGDDSGTVVLNIAANYVNEWDRLTENVDMPQTLIVLTPDGSVDYYFQYQGIEDLASFRQLGLTFRTNGDLVPAPCDEGYEILDGLVDGQFIIADMPDEIIELLV